MTPDQSSRGALPWADLMSFGFGVLRLSPDAFWSMTLRELDAALVGVFGGDLSGQPPGRSELRNLMQRFPDGA